MQYADLTTAISAYAQQQIPSTGYTTAIPTFISNAELRIYRELNFAASGGVNTSLSTATGANVVSLTSMSGQVMPDGTPMGFAYPVVVETLFARVGVRWIPFQLTSLDWIDLVWPDIALTAPPATGFAYYTMLDSQTAKLAPVPDGIYPLRVSGQWRPAPMTVANPITWLGTHLPDLLFAATMAEVYAYQRDMRPGSEQPGGAMLWEARYAQIRAAAQAEEALVKGLGPGYQALAPAPLAHPQPAQPGQPGA